MISLQRGKIATSVGCSLALGLAVLSGAVSPVLADELVNISDITQCRAVKSDAERLLCYDTIADGGIFNEQKLSEVRKDNFGDLDGPAEITTDRLAVTISRVTRSATGIHYFYTADGAVWKQSTARKWNVKAPFEAEIKAGSMSSFFLVAESGKSTRVKRVR